MDLRTKKALTVLLRGVIILGGWTLYGVARGGQLGVNPIFIVCVALIMASAAYTWWWYGDSEKAVASRAKAEAKKAARQQAG